MIQPTKTPTWRQLDDWPEIRKRSSLTWCDVGGGPSVKGGVEARTGLRNFELSRQNFDFLPLVRCLLTVSMAKNAAKAG